MKTYKVQAIMDKIEAASVWYGVYKENVSNDVITGKATYKTSKRIYERTLAEIREMLEA
tara:strand:- start:20 stop:196 length:177 start_codon:yes stop_codon:yes gene_type:complete